MHDLMADGAHERWRRRRRTGFEIGRRVQIVVHDSFADAFAKDGAPNKAQRRRAFEGCGRWHLIPNTAEDRTTRVEGMDEAKKGGGLWSVNLVRFKVRVAGSADFLLFFKSPDTRWPHFLGIDSICANKYSHVPTKSQKREKKNRKRQRTPSYIHCSQLF